MARGADGVAATKQGRIAADAVTFGSGRTGVFACGDVRIGSSTVVEAVAEGRRCSYAVDAYLKGMDLGEIRTRQTLAEPQPEFLSIVPYTGEAKEPRHRMRAMPAAERRAHYVEYEIAYTREEAMAESQRCLQCTCEAIGFCDLRRLGIEHAVILREPARCIDCGRCAQVCKEIVGAACYDFMRLGFDTLVTTPLDMSLNDTPCVSCGRCAETCPTGALMPKPRILEKYEVDESRCILCGICVDACPYDALRCGPDFELASTSREEPMIDLMALGALERDTEISYVQRERDWLERAAQRPPSDGRHQGVTIPATVPVLGWAWDDLLFLGLAGILLGAALLVVLGRDIIHSGLWMMLCFGALAGVYALLGAPLVAVAQVLVYVGAISVLVLFAIMLTQSKAGPLRLVFHRQAWVAAIASIVLFALFVVVVAEGDWPQRAAEVTRTATDQLARLLFNDYVLPFEGVGVLLLAAVIGGVYLAKRDPGQGGSL